MHSNQNERAAAEFTRHHLSPIYSLQSLLACRCWWTSNALALCNTQRGSTVRSNGKWNKRGTRGYDNSTNMMTRTREWSVILYSGVKHIFLHFELITWIQRFHFSTDFFFHLCTVFVLAFVQLAGWLWTERMLWRMRASWRAKRNKPPVYIDGCSTRECRAQVSP